MNWDVCEKPCPVCGTLMKGRTDKKFCSDQCRSAFHNHNNREHLRYVHRINGILMHNHRVLKRLNPAGKRKVTRDRLLTMGFDFHHFTSLYTTRGGVPYYFCYDQGYRLLDNDLYLLVIKKQYTRETS